LTGCRRRAGACERERETPGTKCHRNMIAMPQPTVGSSG
jgi:hypothetical protein